MFTCSFSAPATQFLLDCLQLELPDVLPLDLLYLKFDLRTELELPVTTLLATAYLYLWTSSKKDKPPCGLPSY